MPDDGYVVAWVGDGCLLDGRGHTIAGVKPRLPETVVRSASGTDVGGDGIEVKVCYPCVDGAAATERDDDEVVGVIDCNISSDVS